MELNCLSCVRVLFTHCCISLSLSRSQHTQNKKKNGKEKKKLFMDPAQYVCENGKIQYFISQKLFSQIEKKNSLEKLKLREFSTYW